MTKLEYYLILIAARITGDFITSCLRRLRIWWKGKKAVEFIELNKDTIDLFFYEKDKEFKEWYEKEFGKKK